MRLPLILLPTCALALSTLDTVKGFHGDAGIPTAQYLDAMAKPWKSMFDGVDGVNVRVKRQVDQTSQKWTNNTVYYHFDASINERKKASVKTAITNLQSRTCITFVESNSAPNRIKIYSGEGCSSDSGMIGGEQKMSLGDGCEAVGAVTQQFAHVLGVAPTEQRTDRDEFLTVGPTAVNQYQKKDTSIEFPYEYGSVMHSPATGNSNSTGPTVLIPKDDRYLHTLGSELLSFYDIQAINSHYECNPGNKCKNGGVPSARDSSVCECPLGFGGKYCDEKPDPCGDILEATSEWKTHQTGVGEVTSVARPLFNSCTHWIKAPAGKKIVVKITRMDNFNCVYGCLWNGVEIKGDADPRITNPRYCCQSAIGTIINSELNPTPLVIYSRLSWSHTWIDYHYV